MKPIQFSESNVTLNKPDDMTDEECMPLPVCVCRDSEDLPLIISCWEPTPEEWDALRKQGHIYIAIVSEQYHPPLIVFPNNPFGNAPEQSPVYNPTNEPTQPPDLNCNACGGTGIVFHEVTKQPLLCVCTLINTDNPTNE